MQVKRSLLIFMLSLGIGLVFSFLLYPLLGEATSGLDPDGYGQLGCILYKTGRFDALSRPPLYPAFLALVYSIAGGCAPSAAQVAQSVVAALASVTLYQLMRLTLQDERRAFWAGLAWTVYPISFWYIPRLWTETWLTWMIALATLALIRLMQSPSLGKALLCGLALGLAALSKGAALVLLPLGLLALGLRFRRSAWGWIGLVALSSLALLLPWTIRNWEKTGRLLPIHADSGYNFYLGNRFAAHWLEAPFSYSSLRALAGQDMELVYQQQGGEPVDPLERDDLLLRAALAELRANPGLLLRKLLVQSLTFWYLAAALPQSLLTGALQIPVLLLALPGLARAVRMRSWALGLLFPIVGIFGLSLLVFSFGRLAAPIMPYLIGLAF